MSTSLRAFWEEAPATTLICTAIFAVFGVICLTIGSVMVWDTYHDVYASQGVSFLAICAAFGIAILTGCVFSAGLHGFFGILRMLVILKR